MLFTYPVFASYSQVIVYVFPALKLAFAALILAVSFFPLIPTSKLSSSAAVVMLWFLTVSHKLLALVPFTFVPS